MRFYERLYREEAIWRPKLGLGSFQSKRRRKEGVVGEDL